LTSHIPMDGNKYRKVKTLFESANNYAKSYLDKKTPKWDENWQLIIAG